MIETIKERRYENVYERKERREREKKVRECVIETIKERKYKHVDEREERRERDREEEREREQK